MKKRKSFWLTAAILNLIWTIYYYAKRCTGGIVDVADNIVCGIVGLICVGIIARHIIYICQEKKGSEAVNETDNS